MRNDENQIGGSKYSITIFSYARIHIPIISSVSEHQPTMWTSFITDLHFLPAVAPAGLWYTIRNYDSAKIFLVIYAAFSCYFAGIMVRLMLTLTPVVCMLGGIALNVTFDHFFGEDNDENQVEKPVAKKEAKKNDEDEKEEATPMAIKLTVVMALTGTFSRVKRNLTCLKVSSASSRCTARTSRRTTTRRRPSFSLRAGQTAPATSSTTIGTAQQFNSPHYFIL